jgi:glycolate oxidase iron-sulfur subunit
MRFVERAALDACVHCGLCLASCPTYVELGAEADSPRGRIHLIRALEEGRLEPTPEVTTHLDRCLGCRACETACPSGVRYGRLIEAARPFVEVHRPWLARTVRRGFARVLASPALGRGGLAVLGWLGRRRALARLAPAAAAPWLALAAATRDARVAAPLRDVIEPMGPARGTAALVRGCAPARLFGTAEAAAALLVRAGVRVVLLPATSGCCGALALHLGDATSARALARATVRAVTHAAPDWVVTTAAGCGALVREYDHLLPGDAEAAGVAHRARDPLELLDELGLPPPVRPLPRTVTVHDPCHLAHGQGVRAAVRRLLAAVPGVRLVELDEADTCCGSAGTYNLTEPAMAARLLARKLDRVAASGADIVVAANPGCLLQMRAGAASRHLAVAVEHPLALLATAHGVSDHQPAVG